MNIGQTKLWGPDLSARRGGVRPGSRGCFLMRPRTVCSWIGRFFPNPMVARSVWSRASQLERLKFFFLHEFAYGIHNQVTQPRGRRHRLWTNHVQFVGTLGWKCVACRIFWGGSSYLCGMPLVHLINSIWNADNMNRVGNLGSIKTEGVILRLKSFWLDEVVRCAAPDKVPCHVEKRNGVVTSLSWKTLSRVFIQTRKIKDNFVKLKERRRLPTRMLLSYYH